MTGLEPPPPPTPTPSPTKIVKPRAPAAPRPKPATLVKVCAPKKVKPMVEVSSNEKEQVQPSSSPTVNRSSPPSSSSSGRTLQTSDLQKLSRLTCSREFSYFHKEIKSELKTSEHQLAFLQTKLYHLKNEFINETSEQSNLEQIRNFFAEALQKNIDRKIQPDEFITLADKLKQDIKQVGLFCFVFWI
jgi:outer membrane biosynthesis protein TonB